MRQLPFTGKLTILSMVLSGIEGVSWMVRKYQSPLSSPASCRAFTRLDTDRNESAIQMPRAREILVSN